jgi:hypothetical protein
VASGRLVFCLALLITVFGIFSLPALAQSRFDVALALRASTLGPGLDIHVGATDALRARVGISYLPYSVNQSFDDDDLVAALEGTFRLGGPEIRANWHPFKSTSDDDPSLVTRNSFHLSGGVLFNITEFDAEIAPTAPFEYSDTKTFSVERVGQISATASYPLLAPYLGLGFGDALDNRWSFLVEFGAYYTGPPQFDFSGSGLIEPTTRNADTLEEGFDSFRVFPHLGFGLSYQF